MQADAIATNGGGNSRQTELAIDGGTAFNAISQAPR